MAGLCNLMILGVMLIGIVVGVEGVTDQQFQELSNLVKKLQDENERQFRRQDSMIKELVSVIKDRQEGSDGSSWLSNNFHQFQDERVQNATIEERVSLLEIQVVEIEEDVSSLDEDVDFLFEEQVIQDERLLNLEESTDQINVELEGLQDTVVALDFRVTVLEEIGGNDGNSSISELEERVETLEGTAADHETRISAAETEIKDLEGITSDHETRITAAEENIQGLQMTDINHDVRITALEENGGGGSQNRTIAFQVYLASYSSIADEANVVFDDILLNEGEGYDSTTGVFTVPSSGLYYFSTYLLVEPTELGTFDIRLNDEAVCAAYAHGNANTIGVYPQGTCTAVVNVAEGDEVSVVYWQGTDDTPITDNAPYRWNGFNGFRI